MPCCLAPGYALCSTGIPELGDSPYFLEFMGRSFWVKRMDATVFSSGLGRALPSRSLKFSRAFLHRKKDTTLMLPRPGSRKTTAVLKLEKAMGTRVSPCACECSPLPH